jgi:zinc/manganese transport system substrate-binding protein
MKIFFLLFLFLLPGFSFAEIRVVTSTTVIYDLVKEIGRDKVTADYIARGDQEPHSVEVLPSYMMKLRNADIFFIIGLGLEIWADQLVDGSRNARLRVVDLSENIVKKEVPSFKPDARYGDVHPYGNPHYWMDPENVKIMAESVMSVLSETDAANAAWYKKNYNDFINRLERKITEWEGKMQSVKGYPFLFFHASWIYFADKFGLEIAGYVEPRPGISPSPGHNAELVKLIRSKKIKYLVMENFYSTAAPEQLSELTGINIIKVPTAVYGIKGIDSYIKMMDYIVNKITGS